MRLPSARWGTHRGIAAAATATAGLVLVAALWVLPAGAAPATAVPFPTPIRHVIVVILENEEASTVLANGSYERTLADTYAYADELYSPMHYSLPNYLAATSGYTSNQFVPVRQVNVGTLATNANRTWAEYEESMPTPCDLSSGITAGGYDPFHNAFALYEPFINDTADCRHHMVSFTAWNAAVAAGHVPNYALLVPNVTDDGHNSSLAVADAWLSHWLPPLLNDSFFSSSAIFITYDEGTTDAGVHNSSGGGHIYLALVSPYARMGYWSQVNYTTYSLLTTTEWLLGLGSTHDHDNWTTYPPMKDLFAFPERVSGTVETANGTAVAGLEVSDHDGSSVRTNLSGGFSLVLPSGNFTLYVAPATGYKGHLAVRVSANPISGLVLVVKPVP